MDGPPRRGAALQVPPRITRDSPRLKGRGDGVVNDVRSNSVPSALDAGRTGREGSRIRPFTILAPCSEAITDDSPAHPRSHARSRRRLPPDVCLGRPERRFEAVGGSPRVFERFSGPFGFGGPGARLPGAVPQASRCVGGPGVGRPILTRRCDRCLDPSRDAGASAHRRAGPGASACPHRGSVVARRRVHSSKPDHRHNVAGGRAFGADRFRPATLGDFQQ